MSESASGKASDSCSDTDKTSLVECRLCGETCKGTNGLGTHFRYNHPDEHRIPEEALRRLYDAGMSMREMADELDASKGSIQVAFDIYDIEARKSYRADTYPPRYRFQKISDRVGHEYEVMETGIDYEYYSFFVHRLIAVAHGKLEPSEFRDFNRVVHHKSEHGLDNRPENLEVMDRGDHQSMHVKRRYNSE